MLNNEKQMNNSSDKPEKFEPKDSKRKAVKHPQDDVEAVVKPEDKNYRKENPTFRNPAKSKEESEQPVNPGKEAPKDV